MDSHLTSRRVRRKLALALIPSAAAAAIAAPDARGDIPIRARRVAAGLDRPVFATAAPGDDSRLFIVEQHTGQIKILNLGTGSVNATPFLDLNGISTGNEQGLLGLAFHPDYANNGKFYVNFTAPGGQFTGGQTHVRQYTRSATNPNLADPNSATNILTFDQPQSNHNGGWIGFGPRDSYLYIASGDGGNGNDQGTGHTEPGGNAQDLTNNLLGKMLRLDVNGDDFLTDNSRNYRIPRGGAGQPSANPFTAPTDNRDDEIWSYGLRNPFRASHDRETGDLYIGDVGQGAREEIDVQPGDSAGGENYGWRLREGRIATPGSVGGPPPPGNVDPVYDYDRTVGATVTGGYVYRGNENPALEGTYFFADFGSGAIFTLKDAGPDTNVPTNQAPRITVPTDVGSVGLISSFGEDNQGNLYVVDLGGEVFRLIPAFPGDANLDDTADVTDLGILATNFGRASGGTWRTGDFNDDGQIDVADLGILATYFNRSRGGVGFAEALAQYPALEAEAVAAGLPEPSSLAAFALAGAGLLRRRRRA